MSKMQKRPFGNWVLSFSLAVSLTVLSVVPCQLTNAVFARSKKKPEIVDRVDEKDQAKTNAKLKNASPSASFRRSSDYVSSHILINAPVEVVWKMVHEEREMAPNLVYSKLHKEDTNLLVLEQKWTIVPFVAAATCVISEKETPYSRIDYKVLKSNQFKAMEGAWIFTPVKSNSGSEAATGAFANESASAVTELELTTHIELRGLAPMKLVNAMAKKKIAQRLAHIKELAEKPHANLDVGGVVIPKSELPKSELPK
ncbi:hypothetical protein BH11CYA1_BH11CYA1_20630 [soil metagenome]